MIQLAMTWLPNTAEPQRTKLIETIRDVCAKKIFLEVTIIRYRWNTHDVCWWLWRTKRTKMIFWRQQAFCSRCKWRPMDPWISVKSLSSFFTRWRSCWRSKIMWDSSSFPKRSMKTTSTTMKLLTSRSPSMHTWPSTLIINTTMPKLPGAIAPSGIPSQLLKRASLKD